MERVGDLLQYADVVAFLVLAGVVFRQWRRRRDDSSRWAFLTFGVIAGISVLGLFLPDDRPDTTAWLWFIKAIVAVLLLFPYFLVRLSSSFRHRVGRLEGAAALLTAAIIVWTLLLPDFPGQGEPRPDWFETYITALLAQWVLLSLAVAVRFWRAGKGQPAVARKRMQMLSIASVVLSIGIVISGQSGGDRSAGSELLTRSITTLSVLAFFLAFAPPKWLRTTWRRPVEESLRRGTLDLMAAETPKDVMDVMLPHALGIVGGEGIAVLDASGKVTGSLGMDPAEIARAGLKPTDEEGQEAALGLVHLEFPFGAVIVQTGPYTPFFGQDEIDLLGSLGALANLALERVAAGDLKAQLERADLRRQQALEINDNIVQGLAVAKYSFDLGQEAKARDAVEGTLVAARSIISELLDDLGGDMEFGPGALTRDRAATGFIDSSITLDRREDEESAE